MSTHSLKSVDALDDARIIIDQIDPERLVPGGTDTCIHDLVKYSETSALAIVGVTESDSAQLGQWRTARVADESVPFLPVARFSRTRGSRFLRIPHSVRLAWGLVRFRKQIPGGVLQTHRIETGVVVSAVLRPKRLVQFIHNDSTGLTGGNSDSLWKYLGFLYRACEKIVFRRADQVVLFNQSDSARIKEMYPSLTVAKTWFDPAVFTLKREQWKSGDPLKVLFVGRLESQKDPSLALATFAEVHKRYPNAQMVFVGEGSLRSTIVSQANDKNIADHVVFAGALSRADVARTMADSTVMLMTSHYEGSPRVMAEAGAVGLPVAATSGADPDHVLDREFGNGVRVAAREPRELASAVLLAANFDPQQCANAVAERSAPVAVSRLLAAPSGVSW
jgi:glycosyltransferase involved in cell wall biosynthesis